MPLKNLILSLPPGGTGFQPVIMGKMPVSLRDGEGEVREDLKEKYKKA